MDYSATEIQRTVVSRILILRINPFTPPIAQGYEWPNTRAVHIFELYMCTLQAQ